MSKITITIEDQGDELMITGTVEPPITPDQEVFGTAEIIGMYIHQHMSQIVKDAVQWAKTPDVVEASPILLPGKTL